LHFGQFMVVSCDEDEWYLPTMEAAVTNRRRVYNQSCRRQCQRFSPGIGRSNRATGHSIRAIERSDPATDCSNRAIECSSRAIERPNRAIECSNRAIERSIRATDCSIRAIEQSKSWHLSDVSPLGSSIVAPDVKFPGPIAEPIH
jgi:hypothetical protein